MINTHGYTGVRLGFWRWLGVESWDRAAVQVSNDNTTWITVWSNPSGNLNESSWSYQEYDISAVADNRDAVYIRFSMGPTDPSLAYCGWNIDDVTVTGICNLTAGSTDSDVIRIARSPGPTPKADVFINNSTPTPTYTVPLASLTQWETIGGAGDDQLILDFSNGNPLPTNGLNFDGGDGHNTLSVIGNSSTDSFGVGSLQITHDGTTVYYVNVDALSLASGAFAVAADLDQRTLTAGTSAVVTITTSQHLESLNLGDGSVAQMAAGGEMALLVGGLTINGTGKLDLADHDLLATGMSLGAVQNLITSSQLWSSVAASTGGLKGLALGSGQAYRDGHYYSPVFADRTVVSTDVVVRYTYQGDANLDGQISLDDYLAIDSGYRFGGTAYTSGNFDYSTDGVTYADYALIDRSFRDQARRRPGR